MESRDIVLFRKEMGRRYQSCGSGTETDYHPIESHECAPKCADMRFNLTSVKAIARHISAKLQDRTKNEPGLQGRCSEALLSIQLMVAR